MLSLLVLACSSGRPSRTDTVPDESLPLDDSATPPDSEEPSVCPSGIAATDAPVLWSMSGSDLSFVDGTGAVQSVFSFEGKSINPRAQVSEDYLAFLDLSNDEGAGELALLGRDGALVARATIPEAYTADFWLGEESVAYSPGYVDFSALNPWMDGILLGPDGKTVLDGWIPRGPVADGALPVCATDESTCAWLDIATGKRSGSFSAEAWWTGRYLVWLDGYDLVVATSTSERREAIGLDAILDWNADSVLVGSLVEPDEIVSLETGERLPIGAVPEGWRAFTDFHNYCWNADWNLTSDHRILAVLRNDQVGQVWEHDPVAGTWEPIGSPLADVVYVSVWEQEGTVQIGTVAPVETFCIAPVFEPTSDALVGASVQIVRPVDAIHWINPSWADRPGWASLATPVALHASAVCALSGTGDAVVDLLTGDAVALEGIPAGWLD